MCYRRSHTLHPLTSLTSPRVKFKWDDVEQKKFDEIKPTVAYNILLEYPYFNTLFDLHTYAIYYRFRTVIIKNGKPFFFCTAIN